MTSKMTWNDTTHIIRGRQKGPKISDYVNNIAELNLLHDIVNPTKHDKDKSSHLSLILHGYMNTRRGKEKV